MLNIKRVDQKNELEIDILAAVWESSVIATHTFLTADDIAALRPEVKKGLVMIDELFGYYDENSPVGFIGVAVEKVEMLFVDDSFRGKGIGKQLLSYALKNLNAKYVDVNEQNEAGFGFYKHMGFYPIGRSELDEQGNPFPILHLKLEVKNEN